MALTFPMQRLVLLEYVHLYHRTLFRYVLEENALHVLSVIKPLNRTVIVTCFIKGAQKKLVN